MPAAAQSLQAPYQLPAIEGQETVELCATLAGWQGPAPTRFRNWLWPLVQLPETRTPLLPPETASTTPWAHAPLPAPESLPSWTCTCTVCRAQLQMRQLDVDRLRRAHKLSCGKN